MVSIVVGGYFGDEGKGKIVAYLSQKDRYDIVVRGGVGPNAGHTVSLEERTYGVRMVPSGHVCEGTRLLIGTGVLIDPKVFLHEVETLRVKDRIGIDKRCGIIEDRHIQYEESSDFMRGKIGTTGTGCGPANADRVLRIAKQASEIDMLKEFLTDVPLEINDAIKDGKKILVEGTQGFGISLYYGTYPYVTSKDTTASQIAADVGIGPTRVKDVIIVFKAFPTRVGHGPFPTEIDEKKAESLGIEEYATVTGRKRRIGMWDPELARYSAMINGATQAAITGLDRYDPSCKGCTDYEKLSDKAKEFVRKIQDDVGIPFTLLSTGPEISETIDLR
jgi:adenylosuccinate synthase